MSLHGITKLTARGVHAMILHTLETMGDAWYPRFVKRVTSTDPDSEGHVWLTGVASVREKSGKTEFGTPNVGGLIIRHKDWEVGVAIKLKHWLANKADMVNAMINESIEAIKAHGGLRIQELVVAAESTNCYDGQFFFDTDHSEGESGTQDNDITMAKAGTAPTVAEVKSLILKACVQVMKFKDAKGNYGNMGANDFSVLLPVDIFAQGTEACYAPIVGGGDSNLLPSGQVFKVTPIALPAWSGNKLAVVRNRAPNMGAAFIQQVFTEPEPIVLGPESEHAQKSDEVLIKVRGTYQFGYGRWADACLGTFTGP